MIYFRVRSNSEDPGWLYDRQFTLLKNPHTEPSDLILTATTTQFSAIMAARPTHIVLRVHEDKHNRDITQGVLYDENFDPTDRSAFATGNPVLFTVTPAEFDVVMDTKP